MNSKFRQTAGFYVLNFRYVLYQEAATDGCSIEEVVLKHFADLTKKLLRQDSFFWN